MEYTYRHDLSELSKLAEDLEAFGEENDLHPGVIHCFNLCLDEVLTNIISYGYGDEPEYEHAAHLLLHLKSGVLSAIIRDQGKAFNPLEEAPEPDLEAELEDREIGGLGIHFCKQLMDDLTYRREGTWNILTLSKSTVMPLPED